jgi:hypothetical protein
MAPNLAELINTEWNTPHSERASNPGERVRCPINHRDNWRSTLGWRQQLLEVGWSVGKPAGQQWLETTSSPVAIQPIR